VVLAIKGFTSHRMLIVSDQPSFQAGDGVLSIPLPATVVQNALRVQN
jgi:hypothetical protein